MSTRIELDGLIVDVHDDGTDYQPWGRIGRNGPVFKYKVVVKAPEGAYICPAWGSLADYEQDLREPKEIGFMVLDELLSAAFDPDEFFSIATEGGRDHAIKTLEIISKAKALLPALERNQEKIKAER